MTMKYGQIKYKDVEGPKESDERPGDFTERSMIGTNEMMADGQLLKEMRAMKKTKRSFTINPGRGKYTSPIKNSISR